MPSVQQLKDELEVLIKQSSDLIIQQQNFVDSQQDGLLVAMQLGRLDLVSIIIAGSGVMLFLATLVGYVEIRSKAKREARAIAKDQVNKFLSKYMSNEGLGIIRGHIDVLLPSQGLGDGQEIAENIGDGEGDEDDKNDA